MLEKKASFMVFFVVPLANLSRARLVVFLEFRDRYLSDVHT